MPFPNPTAGRHSLLMQRIQEALTTQAHTGCLLWLGPVRKGRPYLRFEGLDIPVARYLYANEQGKEAPKRYRMVCRNRLCVAPAHVDPVVIGSGPTVRSSPPPALRTGHMIRLLRLARGWTQTDLAERMGSGSTLGPLISTWENGAPIGAENLERLARALDSTPFALKRLGFLPEPSGRSAQVGGDRVLAPVLGRAIQRLRAARGWTQPELAERLGGGVNVNHISRWERGEGLPADMASRLARAFEVDEEELLRAAEEVARNPKGPKLDPYEVGRVIRLLRQERGWTQREMARRLGNERRNAQISRWESGAGIRSHVLHTLARLFGMSYDELLERVRELSE